MDSPWCSRSFLQNKQLLLCCGWLLMRGPWSIWCCVLISQPKIRLEGLLHFIWVWWPMFDSEGSGQYFKFFEPGSSGSDRLLQLLTCTIISWSCAVPLASKCSSPICTPDISCHCFSSLVSRILRTPSTLRIPRVPQNAKWWHLCHLHSFYFLSGH